ncbi:MAG: L,D-transpeptidase, partial [Thermoanaerobaculia bacterium]
HGTNAPESIGGEGSLGCIRMLPDDVGLLYELLSEGRSVVEIRP